MNSGDTIKSGSQRSAVAQRQQATTTAAKSHRDIQPKPFIPKRPPAMQSVYSEDDYDENGELKVLRKIPLGDAYNKKRATALLGSDVGNARGMAAPSMPTTPRAPPDEIEESALAPPPQQQQPSQKYTAVSSSPSPRPQKVAVAQEDAERLKASAAPSEAYSGMPGKPDIYAPPPTKNRLGKSKFDVQTPAGMGDREEQYIAIVRTIENRHPDEDRLLQRYALQYMARKNGTYNPIEDPPVVLSDLLPTCCVVIDRIFSRDEATADEKAVSKYVKRLADRTDLDVVPVLMGKPFHLPLHPLTAFKYKDEVIGQIMQEFYDSREESASEILERVEADREGKSTKQNKWHVYDGISPQGAFGPKSIVRVIDDDKKVDGGEGDGEGDGDGDDDDEEEEFKKVVSSLSPFSSSSSTKKSWGDRVEEADQQDGEGEGEGDDDNGDGDDEEEGGGGEWIEVKARKSPTTTAKMVASGGGKRGGQRRPVAFKKKAGRTQQ